MASIPSNYEVNVARRHSASGRSLHYCRIELGDLLPSDVECMLRDLETRFPAPEFQLTCTRWECQGTRVAL